MTDLEITTIIDRTVTRAEERFEKKMQQYIGAIVEESKHQISAVAEQYGSLNKKADGLADQLENLHATTQEMKYVLETTFETAGSHEERLTMLEAKAR